MPVPNLRGERGIALVVAIAALVVIGALVAGTFYISSIEQKTGENTIQAARAFQIAEAGAQNVISTWDQPTYSTIGVNNSSVLSSTSLGGGSYQVTILPMNSQLYMVKSTGTYAGVTQSTAVILRWLTAQANVNAPMTVTAPVTFNGNSFDLLGVNKNPADSAGCPSPASPDSVVALRSSSTTGMTTKNDSANIVGKGGKGSAVANDASVTTLVNSVFGTGGAYEQLRTSATATKTFDPATYTGVGPTTIGNPPTTCNKSDPMNWGEPQGTAGVSLCAGYYPIVLGKSTYGNPFKISGGRGEGVLLVDGDLELTGGFEWTGLILVKGSFKISGTGAKVLGAVLALNGASVDDNSLSGNTTIQYSSCSISNALKSAGSVYPLDKRAWTQLY